MVVPYCSSHPLIGNVPSARRQLRASSGGSSDATLKKKKLFSTSQYRSATTPREIRCYIRFVVLSCCCCCCCPSAGADLSYGPCVRLEKCQRPHKSKCRKKRFGKCRPKRDAEESAPRERSGSPSPLLFEEFKRGEKPKASFRHFPRPPILGRHFPNHFSWRFPW